MRFTPLESKSNSAKYRHQKVRSRSTVGSGKEKQTAEMHQTYIVGLPACKLGTLSRSDNFPYSSNRLILFV